MAAYTRNLSYHLYIEPFEWGPSVTKAVISLGGGMAEASSVKPNCFTTKVTLHGFYGVEKHRRVITDIYLSDESGSRVPDEKSSFITLEYMCGALASPYGAGAVSGTSAISYNFTTEKNEWLNANYDISLVPGHEITINGVSYDALDVPRENLKNRIIPDAETLCYGTHTHGDITLQTAYFIPDGTTADNNAKPLIVWLHGEGEGGTDPILMMLGGDAIRLAQEKIQRYFPGGAYVFAPQSPTVWTHCDGGEGSVYTGALKSAIDTFIAENAGIDKRRVYIGGASSGGYMTLEMITEYPGFFAAAYPLSPVYKNSYLTDEKINILKDIPMWFVHSRSDTMVQAAVEIMPMYIRLIKSGAKRLHLSFFDTVTGYEAGGVEYYGHFGWIYALQDRCDKDLDGDYILANAKKILDKCEQTTKIDIPQKYSIKNPGAIPPEVVPASDAEVYFNGKAVGLWEWLAGQAVGQLGK